MFALSSDQGGLAVSHLEIHSLLKKSVRERGEEIVSSH